MPKKTTAPKATTPESAKAPVAVAPADDVEPMADAPEPDATPEPEPERSRIDETVPGGRYLVDGKMVDANGEPIKGKK